MPKRFWKSSIIETIIRSCADRVGENPPGSGAAQTHYTMPKPRFKVNLEETLNDAKMGIEEAKNAAAPEELKKEDLQQEPQNEPEQEAAVKQKEAWEGSVPPAPKDNSKFARIRKKIEKPDKKRMNSRNVFLTDDQLQTLETIKRNMNRGRSRDQKREEFIAVTDLLGVALKEFLEKYGDLAD